jgi:hypothetical protein
MGCERSVGNFNTFLTNFIYWWFSSTDVPFSTRPAIVFWKHYHRPPETWSETGRAKWQGMETERKRNKKRIKINRTQIKYWTALQGKGRRKLSECISDALIEHKEPHQRCVKMPSLSTSRHRHFKTCFDLLNAVNRFLWAYFFFFFAVVV